MKTINDVLNQKHESKSKAELVSLLSNLSELITVEEYQKVSGVDPKNELDKLTKKELVSVIDDFRENYNAKWEENLANASTEIMRGVFGMIEADEAMFGAMAAGDADFAAELGSIDFENLIGGPMQAAVKAQNSASLATVAFIQEIGFVKSSDPEAKQEIRMVDFTYTKDVPDTSEGAAEDATVKETVIIEVPFISILNIPSLRIETLDIDFNVKLSSTYKRDISSSFGINSSFGLNLSVVKFKVSSSYKRASSTGVKVEKEYSMNVKVKATNDEMPAGLEKVLGMMSS